jgi:hypothetical protein
VIPALARPPCLVTYFCQGSFLTYVIFLFRNHFDEWRPRKRKCYAQKMFLIICQDDTLHAFTFYFVNLPTCFFFLCPKKSRIH